MTSVGAMLRQAKLFHQAQQASLDRLAEQTRVRRFPRGRRLVRQGEPGDCLYVIVHGRVRVLRSHPDLTDPVVLGELTDGDVVGELGLLDGQPRSATVVALEPTQALEIGLAAVQDTLTHDPQIAAGLLRILSTRLRRTDELIEDLATIGGPTTEALQRRGEHL